VALAHCRCCGAWASCPAPTGPPTCAAAASFTLQVNAAAPITRVEREQLEPVQLGARPAGQRTGVARNPTLQTVGRTIQLLRRLPGEQDPTRAAKFLGSTQLCWIRAQRQATEQENAGAATRSSAQAEAVLARPRGPRPARSSPGFLRREQEPPPAFPPFPAKELVAALTASG